MAKTRFDWVGPGLIIAGRYRIEAPLGEGGYGAVYVATQTNLDRKVALKLLHPEVLVRERARERFAREARVTQQLAHPNVVRLYDFGTSEQGLPFIVCELLEGRSLEQEIRARGAFSVARVAHVTQQILKALAEAHARGIVHRDVKPANVFLCDYAGEADFVKVLDFGIAAAPLEGGASGLTQEGVSLGTPAYMSPEQVLDQPLDGRADLYSVGLVMAEMLTGVPVYQGTVAMQIALAQIDGAPVPLPPSVIESPLGGFIQRATQKSAAHRFASALEMLEALRRIVGAQGYGYSQTPAHGVVHPHTHAVANTGALAGVSRQEPWTGARMTPQRGSANPPLSHGSSVSMPLAAPLPPPKAESKSKKGLVVLSIVSGAIAIAAVTYAVTITMTSRSSSDTRAKTPAKTATTVVLKGEDDEEDPEDDIDKQMDAYEKQIMEGLLKAPMGAACPPLTPKQTAFVVKGAALADVISRAERGGYTCQNHHAISEEAGMIAFTKGFEPGFSLMYLDPSHAVMANGVPYSVTVSDDAVKKQYVVMALDNDVETAKKISALLMSPTPPPPR